MSDDTGGTGRHIPRGERLAALDAFRGLTIAGMLLVNNPGTWSAVYPPLRHAEWHGWTPTDLIFPFFLFIVGITTHLSLASRERRGDPPSAITRQILRRGGLIVLLGLLLAAADAPAAPKDPVAKPAGAPVEGTVRSLADKTPIHYRSTGKGGLSVVLIHCWSCDSSMWDETAAELAKTRRVVTVDLAGHGASGRERKAWTVRSYAADVKSVIEALGLRRVILVGHSMGGVVRRPGAAHGSRPDIGSQ